MTRPFTFLLCVAMGCASSDRPDATATGAAENTPQVAPDPTGVETPTGGAAPIALGSPHIGAPKPYVPKTPVGPFEIVTRPDECPQLAAPKPGADPEALRVHRLAKIVRDLSCDVSLYKLSSEALLKRLDPPDGVELEFRGLAAVAVNMTEPPDAMALARALGIEKPVIKLEWQAYHDRWWLGSNAETGDLDRFGPGKVLIRVNHDAVPADKQGKVIPLMKDMQLDGYGSIFLSDKMLTIQPDPEGLKQLVTAMTILAAEPERLAMEPEKVEADLLLAGERWRVARTSLHSGDMKIDGISLQPMRTRIQASALVRALGIKEATAYNTNREHDVWEVSTGDPAHDLPWHGLNVTLRLNGIDADTREAPLGSAVVDFIQLRP